MNVIPNRIKETSLLPEQWAGAAGEAQAGPPSGGRIHVIPIAAAQGRPPSGIGESLYRFLEVGLALVGLIVGLPFVLAAMALIRLDSPGPVLFRHRRPAQSARMRGRDLVGRADLIPPADGYEPDTLYYAPSYFTLVKLRTMRVDARARFPAFYAYRFTPENFHAQMPTHKDDPRVTRVGKILRSLSIDEIPNLWSVVVGDMRLVGPRPEASEVLQYYTPEEMTKFTLKPGISGLAQISGRGLLNWGETIALDLEYIRTRTIGLDLKIIFLTLVRVVARHGAF